MEVVKNIMRFVWKSSKGLVVRDLENNLFVFYFFSFFDRRRVLEEGFWFFDGYFYLLKEMRRNE